MSKKRGSYVMFEPGEEKVDPISRGGDFAEGRELAGHVTEIKNDQDFKKEYMNPPVDNSPIETDGVYVDKCECGNWKVSQDGECCQCWRKHWELECKVIPNDYVELQKELMNQKAHTSHYKSKLKELESYDKAVKRRMGLELSELKREKSALIARIRRMERQRSIALLALEEEI